MKNKVAIIGGGSSALLAAAFLDQKKFDVTIYEKNSSLGRKLLVAGKGGFNLTHSEPIGQFVSRYQPSSFFAEVLKSFSNADLRNWLENIRVPTMIGSSGRVYPEKGIAPIDVLNNVLDLLNNKGVSIITNYAWKGWGANNELIFNDNEIVCADYVIFSLGGSSWKVTGSDGSWKDIFEAKGIGVKEFKPSNCAYGINWVDPFIYKNEGKPLKNIAVSIGNQHQKGELVVTKFGIEGNAIYALSPAIQSELSNKGEATIFIDLKPMLNDQEVFQKLAASGLKTTEALKKRLKLSATQVDLIKSNLTKEQFTNPRELSAKIKALPLTICSAAPIDEAISTMGGLSIDELDKNFGLKKLQNTFCIGEMVDWNAPTGGYLLQGCFSMGVHVARYLNRTL